MEKMNDNDFYCVSATGCKSYVVGRDMAYDVALDFASKHSSPAKVYKWDANDGIFSLDGTIHAGGGRA